MKKSFIILMIVLLSMLIVLIGCTDSIDEEPVYDRYNHTFFDAFDTVTQIVGYTETEEEFNEYAEFIENRLWELHRLYDRFNHYDGINNIKTINDHAGEMPVKVEQEILDLIQFSKDWFEPTQGKMNIAIGSLSVIWSEYREEANFDPNNAALPPMDILEKAAEHIDINKVIVNHEEGTVFLEDPDMILDVGAVAKGYAVELAINEVMEKGFTSGIISVGGNVRSFGKPLDGERDRWGIGIHDPDKQIFDTGGGNLDTIFINDSSVVASGDYQRYYVVEGEIIHHIIDPETSMPGDYYRAVTVVTQDSGLADYLSTAVFLLPFEESFALVEELEDVEALWVMKDGTVEFSEGLRDKLRSQGASGRDN